MEIAEKLNQIFHGSSRAHGTFTVENNIIGQKTQGKAKTIKTVGASIKHWQDHLEGKQGLGIIPIDEDNLVKWGAIDIDIYSLNLEKQERWCSCILFLKRKSPRCRYAR